MALGTKDCPIFYFNLTAIAVDILQKLYSENEMGWGWKKLPRNKIDIKIKIVQLLLAMRKLVDERYMLDQNKFMEMIVQKLKIENCYEAIV